MKQWLLKKWSTRNWLTIVLLPVSLLYRVIIAKKRQSFLTTPPPKHRVPVIVVGNIYVGGTGKTPVVIYLVNLLQKQGYKPAVISRGYGAKIDQTLLVTDASIADEVGDEPLLIFNNCKIPVVVNPKRNSSVEYLLENTDCNIIISDDGLQHYALNRDIEIVVFDAQKGIGNGFLLPSGPLREPFSRAKAADFTLVNGNSSFIQGHNFILSIEYAQNMVTGEKVRLKDLTAEKVHAVAGIGNPARFFSALKNKGLHIIAHEFADHYPYTEKTLDFIDGFPVLMTEKDAVKCQGFAKSDWWTVPADTVFVNGFAEQLLEKLKQVENIRQVEDAR